MGQYGVKRLKPLGCGFFRTLPVIADGFRQAILSSSNGRTEQETTTDNII
jgi:hypothetical protein